VVRGICAVSQAQQAQCRYGTGRGLGIIMRQLPQEQRKQVAQILSSLPQDLRPQAVSQLRQIDAAALSADQLYEQVMDVLNSIAAQVSQTLSGSTVDVYA